MHIQELPVVTREINRTHFDERSTSAYGGEETCVMKYRLYYSTEIKNLTFHCDNGCCGRMNKQYCCLSTPAYLGFLMTTAIVGFLCLAAVSNYIMNKCDKQGRSSRGVDKKSGPSVPCSPVYRSSHWTTASSGAPLPQYSCIPPQPYGYHPVAGYICPHAAPFPFMGASHVPHMPIYAAPVPYEEPKPPEYPAIMNPSEGGRLQVQPQILPACDRQVNPPAYPGRLTASAPGQQR